MKTFEELMLSNRAWAREMRERKDSYFAEQAGGQQPEILWIGCSDSRVSPEQITQTRPGEMFIHRNIANLVHENDDNLSSVLQFAVEVLGVRHIVVCGHYGCGGIEAALKGGQSGPIGRWLEATNAQEPGHRAELDALSDHEGRAARLVELNVRDQIATLARTPIVRKALDGPDELTLHGLVYDLRNGLLTELLTLTEAPDGAIAAPEPVLAQAT